MDSYTYKTVKRAICNREIVRRKAVNSFELIIFYKNFKSDIWNKKYNTHWTNWMSNKICALLIGDGLYCILVTSNSQRTKIIIYCDKNGVKWMNKSISRNWV